MPWRETMGFLWNATLCSWTGSRLHCEVYGFRFNWQLDFLRVHRVCYSGEQPGSSSLMIFPLILCKFNAILSSAAISVMLGYFQPIIIRVFWPSACVFLPRFSMTVSWPILSWKERGPFNLGKWSGVINIASFLVCLLDLFSYYVLPSRFVLDGVPGQFIFICVLFILPTARPVTRSDMNYAVVSVGGIFLIVGLVWVTWGQTRFVGFVHTNPGVGSLGPSHSEIPSKNWNFMNTCAALVIQVGEWIRCRTCM